MALDVLLSRWLCGIIKSDDCLAQFSLDYKSLDHSHMQLRAWSQAVTSLPVNQFGFSSAMVLNKYVAFSRYSTEGTNLRSGLPPPFDCVSEDGRWSQAERSEADLPKASRLIVYPTRFYVRILAWILGLSLIRCHIIQMRRSTRYLSTVVDDCDDGELGWKSRLPAHRSAS